jgi:hypothetical protein
LHLNSVTVEGCQVVRLPPSWSPEEGIAVIWIFAQQIDDFFLEFCRRETTAGVVADCEFLEAHIAESFREPLEKCPFAALDGALAPSKTPNSINIDRFPAGAVTQQAGWKIPRACLAR